MDTPSHSARLRRWLVMLGLLLAVGVASPPAAAHHLSGTTYRGRTANGGFITFAVSRDGSEIESVMVSQAGFVPADCGQLSFDTLTRRDGPPVEVRPSAPPGTYLGQVTRMVINDHQVDVVFFRSYNGLSSYAIKATFNAVGHAEGTLIRTHSPGCSAQLQWEARADVIPLVRPGGVWMSPTPPDGAVQVTSPLRLAVRAYPTSPSDPPIERVHFTAWWPGLGPENGRWQNFCAALTPSPVYGGGIGPSDVYECYLDAAAIPAGEVRISFDVYDRAGNSNLSPNGIRRLGNAPQCEKVPGTLAADQLLACALKLLQNTPSGNKIYNTVKNMTIVFAETPDLEYGEYCPDPFTCDLDVISIASALTQTSPEALAAVLAHEGTHAQIPLPERILCIRVFFRSNTIAWEFDAFKKQIEVWNELKPARWDDSISMYHEELASLSDDELRSRIKRTYTVNGKPDGEPIPDTCTSPN